MWIYVSPFTKLTDVLVSFNLSLADEITMFKIHNLHHEHQSIVSAHCD